MSEKRAYFKPTVVANKGGEPSVFRTMAPNDAVIGEYLTTYQTPSPNAKAAAKGEKVNNHKIRVLESNFTAVEYVGEKKEKQEVKDLKGKVLVLNGNGRLDKFIEKVSKGMLVDIEYAGKLPGDDGEKYHQYHRLEAGYADGAGPQAETSSAENGL